MAYETQIAYVRSVLAKIEKAIQEKEEWFSFSTTSSDGRRNSQDDEPEVANYLLEHPELKGLLVKKVTKKKKLVEEEDNRAFGDIGIDVSAFGEKDAFPCNIKIISKDNTAGNNTCGLIHLISYTFEKRCSNHDQVMERLVEIHRAGYNSLTPRLYGIIMVCKEIKKCWVGTFDEVPEKYIGTNPSNPLQVPFLTEKVSRTKKEYITLLIKKIVEYHEKKSRPLAIWNSYMSSKKEE